MARRVLDLFARILGDSSVYEEACKKSERATEQFERKLKRARQQHNESLDKMARGAAIFGAASFAAVGVAVKAYADFDSAMSKVQAVMHTTAGQQARLRDLALEQGKATKYSATEAAAGIEELAKAGVGTRDILGGGLKGALALAAAGEMNVADAAEIAASTMVQFGLKGSKVGHIADLLSAAANKAQGSVSDVGVALKYVGPVAASMGISLEQTTGAIAELASNGILADQAGTSLRGMLASLTSPGLKASALMHRLGIDVYDSHGKFIGLNGVAQVLHDRLGKLKPAQRDFALGTLFGNHQVTAARILMKGGADAVNTWTKRVNDAGNASRTAGTKMDNLKGDVEQLKGSIETGLIGAGSGANTTLRGLTQAATGAVNAFVDLRPATQQTVLASVAAAGAIALLAAGMLKGIVKANELRWALFDMSRAAKLTSLAAFGIGTALTIGIAIWAHYKAKQAEAKQYVNQLTDTLDKNTGAITRNTRAAVVDDLEKKGYLKTASTLGLNLGQVTDAAMGNEAAMRKLAGRLREIAKERHTYNLGTRGEHTEYTGRAKAAQELLKQLGLERDALKGSRAEWKRRRDAMRDNTGSAHNLAKAQRGVTKASDAASVAAATNGATLDKTTAAGKANQHALHNLVARQRTYIANTIYSGASTKTLSSRLTTARANVASAARQMGMGTKQADRYAKKLITVPKSIKTNTSAPGLKVTARNVDDYRRLIKLFKSRHLNINVDIAGSATDYARKNHLTLSNARNVLRSVYNGPNHTGGGFAFGGRVIGVGGERSDHIDGRKLSHNEHVITAREVRGAGGHAAVEMQRRKWAAAHTPGYVQGWADGGPVVTQLEARPGARHVTAGEYGSSLYYANAVASGTAMGIIASIHKQLGALRGSFQAGLNFVKRETGKPYGWGQVGPASYDCSGLQSAVTNVIKGERSPYHRLFATASFSGGRGTAGFVRGLKSPYMIGVLPGSHMAGTILGTNIESSGSVGPHYGPSARGAGDGMFPYQFGFSGLHAHSGRTMPKWEDDEGLSVHANGGIEDHQAQLSHRWRVWGEPETHGEAYIPLAASKRARSTSVLGNVADRFGYTLTPGEQRFDVAVYIGNERIRDIARVEVTRHDTASARRVRVGSR